MCIRDRINSTQVVVESYSENKQATPGYANIIMKNSGVTLLSSKTVYNILKNTDLRLDSIVKTDKISEQEDNNSKVTC